MLCFIERFKLMCVRIYGPPSLACTQFVGICFITITVHIATVLLIFVDIYHFNYTFSHAHIKARTGTHKHTCTVSTQEEWRQPDTGAWWEEAGKKILFETRPLQKKSVSTPISQTSKKYPSKSSESFRNATRLFLLE